MDSQRKAKAQRHEIMHWPKTTTLWLILFTYPQTLSLYFNNLRQLRNGESIACNIAVVSVSGMARTYRSPEVIMKKLLMG
jgi:hypothetical protein